MTIRTCGVDLLRQSVESCIDRFHNPLTSGTSGLGTLILITNNNALIEAGGAWGAIMIVYLLAA